MDKVDFVVIDKKTQEDITRSILLQVIAEQEHAGEPLMSQDFLSQVIRSYGGAMQNLVGSYLEQSLKLLSSSATADPRAPAQLDGHRRLRRDQLAHAEEHRALALGAGRHLQGDDAAAPSANEGAESERQNLTRESG